MFKNTKINLLIASLFSLGASAADLTTNKIEVISSTPLPGIGVSLNSIPSNVQTIKGSDIQKSQALDLSSYMNQNLGSVYINETQGNPLQGDLNYRGFTASPLLGTPQGLSVYMDGVRLNQPFGDVVSWDLIPKNAIKSVQLMPGSNPLFGLNTLGGAISIQTKDGRNSPGGALQTSFGSFRRNVTDFEYGGSKDNFDYFLAGSYFDENGWRKQSESDLKQLFGKFGWQNDKTDIKLTVALADSDLNGNGLAPRSTLSRDRAEVYTYPDNTQNKSTLLNLQISHYFKPNVLFSANTYYRNIRTASYNADINDTALPNYVGGGGQTINYNANGTTSGLSSYVLANASRTNYGCIGEASDAMNRVALGGEPGEKCSGLINRSSNKQENAGIFAQVSVDNKFFGKANTYTVGGGFDWSKSHFISSSEYGYLSNGREGATIIGSGYFADQNTLGNIDGEIDDRSVNLKGKTKTWSAYFTDTLEVQEKVKLTGSARYNYTKITNRDQQTHYELGDNTWTGFSYKNLDNVTTYLADTTPPALNLIYSNSGTAARSYTRYTRVANNALGDIDSEASLSGDHSYHRINPALGLTWDANDNLNIYGGYNEGSRAPTSIELGCANPNNGCRLPNSMAGDPHLDQVVSKTYEAGFRGKNNGYAYGAGVYNTRNYQDILFVASSVSEGYFKNFGITQRRGLEASLGSNFGNLMLVANYSFIDATYESNETVGSAANSSASETTGASSTVYTNEGTAGDPATTYSTTYKERTGGVDTYGGTITQTAQTENQVLPGETYKTINIRKGNKIPLIPRNMLKLIANYRVNDQFNIGVDTITVTGSYLRGNENNQHQSNGSSASGGYYGSGKTSGYTVANLSLTYQPKSDWVIFGRVNNLFDKEYETGGMLGVSPYNPATGDMRLSNGQTTAVGEAFVSPGAPRSAWVGVRWEFK